RIALDDFVFRPELEPLLDFCDLVKLDVLALGPAGVREQVARLRPRGMALLAEKIDSHEDFAFCKELGFDYYQGHFLCKPHIVHSKKVVSHRCAVLELLSRLQQPEVRVEALVADISRDVTLSYKLLRYVNSAGCGLARTIDSLRQAVMYIGTTRLRSLASLLLL